MKVIDLSHLINSGISVFPGTELPVTETLCSVEREGFSEMRFTMNSHCGTHIDAPAHMIAGAMTIDQIPAGNFIGRAFGMDCRNVQAGEISLDLVTEQLGHMDTPDFLLF